MSDEDADECVQRMLRGDEDAFRLVYRATHPGLLRYLTVLLGPSDAEDVASETWAQAFRDLHRFSGTADGFRGWIVTIGRHRALDLLRSRARRPVVDLPVDQLLELRAPGETESDVLALFSTQEALRIIAALPQDQAEAVLLRVVLGLDAKTAAQVLGKRPGAVRMAGHRGLRALAEKLSRQTSDTSDGTDADEVR